MVFVDVCPAESARREKEHLSLATLPNESTTSTPTTTTTTTSNSSKMPAETYCHISAMLLLLQCTRPCSTTYHEPHMQ